MANSVKEPTTPGKRERLVASAAQLLLEQGAQGPTLAEIAAAADVPLGNVYYYFKTRDDLVHAVVDAHLEQVRALLAALDRRSTPVARLKGLAKNWFEESERVAAHGCPLGSICSEVQKLDRDLGPEPSRIFDLLIDWAATQFREMGHRRDARELAVTLIARVQGAALLTNVLDDPKLLKSQVRSLERWIEELDQHHR